MQSWIIILDSGADTSALPLKFASVCVEGPAPETCYVDAQGTPLDVKSTRHHMPAAAALFRHRVALRLEYHALRWQSMSGERRPQEPQD